MFLLVYNIDREIVFHISKDTFRKIILYNPIIKAVDIKMTDHTLI